MRGKAYRDSFVEAHLSTNIAAQIQTLREARGWTQKELGEKSGMAQNRISVLEDPAYDKFTFSTLRRIASACDVALIARFVPFSELIVWVSDLSPEKLTVPDFEHDSLPMVRPYGGSLAGTTSSGYVTTGTTASIYGAAHGMSAGTMLIAHSGVNLDPVGVPQTVGNSEAAVSGTGGYAEIETSMWNGIIDRSTETGHRRVA